MTTREKIRAICTGLETIEQGLAVLGSASGKKLANEKNTRAAVHAITEALRACRKTLEDIARD